MAGITLAQAQTKLDEYLAAESKILAGQKVELDGRALTRADLAQVQKGVELWDSRVKVLAAAAAGRSRMRTVAPGRNS